MVELPVFIVKGASTNTETVMASCRLLLVVLSAATPHAFSIVQERV